MMHPMDEVTDDSTRESTDDSRNEAADDSTHGAPDVSFAELGLAEPLRRALAEEGYEAPTPIQARAIPALLGGRDVLGQAQTGTGKTAAFALPMLQGLSLEPIALQGLVLTPTRELAIQVAEAIHTYARHLRGVRVAPIYGGQPMPKQLRRLEAGLHVVVGTPGRLLDHLRRGTLDLSAVTTLVLDEADEMLRMGFIDDVETLLAALPAARQTALFSATMPAEIVRVAERHLREPVHLEIERRTVTVPTVAQRYLNVGQRQKLDALTRILEVEETDGVLVFVRTKTGAAELTERLQRRGWDAEAMHGDMSQAQRETVVRRLRGGQVDIVVATDVAARGLDVERITHVVNHDISYDPESYVHRIGRTARAGRAGVSVLFVTPRETRLLREIERFTGQRITPMRMPTRADVAARRVEVFRESLKTTIAAGNLEAYLALVEEIAEEGPYDMAEIAAAAARLAGGDRPLELGVGAEPAPDGAGADATVRLFINAGRQHGLRPADIVGAVANETGIPGAAITGIDIYDRFTFLEVPARYQQQVLAGMSGAAIRNRPVSVTVAVPRAVEDGEQRERAAAAADSAGEAPSAPGAPPPVEDDRRHGPDRAAPGAGRRESRAERRERERREQREAPGAAPGGGEAADRERVAPARRDDSRRMRARDRETAEPGARPARPPRADRWTERRGDRPSPRGAGERADRGQRPPWWKVRRGEAPPAAARGERRREAPGARGDRPGGGERREGPRGGGERWRDTGGRRDRPGVARYEPPWKRRRGDDRRGDRRASAGPPRDRDAGEPGREGPPAERPFVERDRAGGRWKPAPRPGRPFRQRPRPR
jgi:ATP-dependent RNA helicase DeaD